MASMNPTTRRVTVYFDPDLHHALRLRSAALDRSISHLVNDAVRHALAEDATDLKAIRTRAGEPVHEFESFVRDLKRRGAL